MLTDDPKRPSMSKARRARIFLAHDGMCELCGKKIIGAYEIEHRDPWWISHRDDDDNLYPAHPECHREKTRIDKGNIGKIKRIQARENGTRRERPKIASRGFDKRLTKGFNGKVRDRT